MHRIILLLTIWNWLLGRSGIESKVCQNLWNENHKVANGSLKCLVRCETFDIIRWFVYLFISEILGFDGKYPTFHPRADLLRFLVKNCKKSAVKHSIEKSYFAQICEFVSNLLRKIVWENRFLFLTHRSSNWFLRQLSCKKYLNMISFKKHYFTL